MITAKTTPLYLEKAVAERLGISRKDARYLRVELLKKKKDWTILGRDLVLSQAALDRMVKYMRKADNDLPEELDFRDCRYVAPAEKKTAATTDLVTLQVHRTLANPRLLVAATAERELVNVQVKSNANFRPGMSLTARPAGERKFKMEGRCPRFPGRY